MKLYDINDIFWHFLFFYFTKDGDARLHLGYLLFDSNEKVRVTFFVIHPNRYGPYQHRFKTNSLTKWVNEALAYAVGGVAGAAATAGFAALFATSVAAGGTFEYIDKCWP